MVSTRKLGQVILTTLINRPIQVLRAFRPAFSKFRCSWRTAFLRRPPWHIASSTARRAIPVAISSSSRSYIQPPHLSNRAELSPIIQARTSRLTREPGVRPARGMNGAQSSAAKRYGPPIVVCMTSLTRKNGKKGTMQREATKEPNALNAVFCLSTQADSADCFQWRSVQR